MVVDQVAARRSVPPASSSARKASTMSRGGLRPLRSRSRTTASIIASMSFMSTAPRPQTQPSAISPGERVVGPVVGVGRHDVGVAVDEQRRAATGPRPRSGPRSRRGPCATRRSAARARPRRASPRRTRRRPAPRARVVAVVAGVDPDQIAAELDDLVLAGDATGRCVTRSTRSRCLAFAAAPLTCAPAVAPSSSPVRPHRAPEGAAAAARPPVPLGRVLRRPAQGAVIEHPRMFAMVFHVGTAEGRAGRHLVRVAEWQTR